MICIVPRRPDPLFLDRGYDHLAVIIFMAIDPLGVPNIDFLQISDLIKKRKLIFHLNFSGTLLLYHIEVTNSGCCFNSLNF